MENSPDYPSIINTLLQAIRNAGTSPQDYLNQVCRRTERYIALQNAWSYLRGYPFSSFSMIGATNREILLPNLGKREILQKEDSYICFDACLSIVEVLLDEGAYRSAQQHIKRLIVLEEFARQELNTSHPASSNSSKDFEVFSGELIIRYLIWKVILTQESGQVL